MGRGEPPPRRGEGRDGVDEIGALGLGFGNKPHETQELGLGPNLKLEGVVPDDVDGRRSLYGLPDRVVDAKGKDVGGGIVRKRNGRLVLCLEGVVELGDELRGRVVADTKVVDVNAGALRDGEVGGVVVGDGPDVDLVGVGVGELGGVVLGVVGRGAGKVGVGRPDRGVIIKPVGEDKEGPVGLDLSGAGKLLHDKVGLGRDGAGGREGSDVGNVSRGRDADPPCLYGSGLQVVDARHVAVSGKDNGSDVLHLLEGVVPPVARVEKLGHGSCKYCYLTIRPSKCFRNLEG